MMNQISLISIITFLLCSISACNSAKKCDENQNWVEIVVHYFDDGNQYKIVIDQGRMKIEEDYYVSRPRKASYIYCTPNDSIWVYFEHNGVDTIAWVNIIENKKVTLGSSLYGGMIFYLGAYPQADNQHFMLFKDLSLRFDDQDDSLHLAP